MNRVSAMLKMALFAIVVIIAAGCAAAAADDPLEKLIPEDKWFSLGLFKLTANERKDLALEISRIALRPHRKNPHGRGDVGVIAPSSSTEKKADEILDDMRLDSGPLRGASELLVVVRSSMDEPLDDDYDSICELIEEAERQFNMVGPTYHIYFYFVDEDLSVRQISHKTEDE